MTRVFISYVREDSLLVDRIVEALHERGLDVWLDRSSLEVGDRWKETIRNAIRAGDYFVACFSPAYVQRVSTYMNEELLVAVDELRLRTRRRRFFLPVKLGPCDIPHYPIGPGETLQDIHHIDLSDDFWSGVASLAAATRGEGALTSSEFIADVERALKSKRWKDADILTDALMVDAAGRRPADWVRNDELARMHCGILRKVDSLWLAESDGRFGFSVQMAIWRSLDSVGVHTPADGDLERAFGNRVGWRQDGAWLEYDDYTFDMSAPLGHLPRHYCRHASGWWLGRSSIIAGRLQECPLP